MPHTSDEIAAAAATYQLPEKPATEEVQAAAGEADAGETDQNQGPVITHSEPILAGGSAGPIVKRLVELLNVTGHNSNTIAQGENPGMVLDASVMADVEAFAKDHDITEDPGLGISGKFVGPATWQALFDEAEKVLKLA